MTTKLEAIVDYLAGRDGDPSLLRELADPSSEASRFLESTRDRSRALFAPESEGPAARPDPRKPRLRAVATLAWASAAALALGAVLGLGEYRGRRLESLLARLEGQSRAKDEQVEALLARLAESRPEPGVDLEPLRAALGQVEAGLDRLERKLGDSKPSTPDPALAEVRDQLASIRRDLSALQKPDPRPMEDLQASVHEVARLLRLLIGRSQPSPPPNEPGPGFPGPRTPNGGDPRRNF